MENLVGHKILKIFIDSESQEILMFKTQIMNFIYEAYGDCCSESWFADVVSINSLIGHTVLSVDKINMGEVDDNRSRQECDEAYCYKFKTTGGYADIVFRNSSNGYYGGWIEEVTEVNRDIKFIELTEDYSA